jgi:hypothetical protein
MFKVNALVGSDCGREFEFVESVKGKLGIKATHREVIEADGATPARAERRLRAEIYQQK